MAEQSRPTCRQALKGFSRPSSLSQKNRLSILKTLARTKCRDTHLPSLKERREEFEDSTKFDHLKKAPCWVCDGIGEARHHVIQLQHGGINIEKNIVGICHFHHKLIHPWMRDKERERLRKKQEEKDKKLQRSERRRGWAKAGKEKLSKRERASLDRLKNLKDSFRRLPPKLRSEFRKWLANEPP